MAELGMHTTAVSFMTGLGEPWRTLVADVGACLLEPALLLPPYESLVRAVSHQQLHAKAGDAILGRMLELVEHDGFPSPAQIRAIPVEDLRRSGFSGRKCETIHRIAEAAISGLVPGLDEALASSNDELIARITQLHGIGQWTVEMFLIFGLGRPDVMPVSDFGINDGLRILFDLERLPTPTMVRALTAKLAPYRSVAAWYLWRTPK